MDINHASAGRPPGTPRQRRPKNAAATMTISARPSARWFRFTARVTGVPIEQRCRLVVVARDGGEYTAGAWTVTGESSTADGITLLAPWQVYAVELRDAAGDLLTQHRMI
jgi:hypothetical protein